MVLYPRVRSTAHTYMYYTALGSDMLKQIARQELDTTCLGGILTPKIGLDPYRYYSIILITHLNESFGNAACTVQMSLVL